MMDRRISPLTKAIAWLFAIVGVLIILGMVWEGRESAKRVSAAVEQEAATADPVAEPGTQADAAGAAMPPEEQARDGVEGKRRSAHQRSAELEVFGSAQCKELVLQDLHDPHGVRWEPADSWGWEEQGDGVVLVQPRFRARNPAGAYVAGIMDCYLDTGAGTVSPVRDASLLMPRSALAPPHPTP